MASKFDLNIAGIPGVAPKIAPVVVGFAEVGLGRSLGSTPTDTSSRFSASAKP